MSSVGIPLNSQIMLSRKRDVTISWIFGRHDLSSFRKLARDWSVCSSRASTTTKTTECLEISDCIMLKTSSNLGLVFFLVVFLVSKDLQLL